MEHQEYMPQGEIHSMHESHGGEKKRGGWKLFLIAVVAFIVGLGISWFIFEPPRAGEENGGMADALDTAAPLVLLGSNAIAVNNQPAGSSVLVQMAVFAEPGWVAIHEERDGGLGNTLGAGWFPAGQNSGTIELLRGTVPGGTYYAVLHKDDGDRQYNYKIDAPLTDPEGNALMMKFVAE